MTTAHHLRLIDEMRAREFPAQRVPSGSGVSGPGYHTAFLHADDTYGEGAYGANVYGANVYGEGDRDEAGRIEHRAQCLAEHDALLTLLSARWSEPQTVSLWSAQERMAAGEVIPEPWAAQVASCEYLLLWQVGGRWIALGLCPEEDGPGCELSVVVTVLDPPC